MSERDNSTGKGKSLDFGDEPKKKPTGQHPAASAPRSTGLNPALAPPKTGSHAAGSPLKTGSHPAQPQAVTTPGAASGPRQLTAVQKSQLSSAFQGDREAQSKARLALTLGNTAAPLYDDDDEPTALGVAYDGESPAKELVNRDLWKAVQAPVQSREGRRSAALYRMVINQFAVGNNPRYENDAPDKARGHIFVWDVSRAMNCEIPHFVGAKELSLAQTVDWLRHEGPMRGWTRATLEDAHQQALAGHLAIAIPKDIKIKHLAVILPEDDTAPDGKPFVAAAGNQRGKRLTLAQALGGFQADCFVHA